MHHFRILKWYYVTAILKSVCQSYYLWYKIERCDVEVACNGI